MVCCVRRNAVASKISFGEPGAALNKPELVRAIAPNWSYFNEDGMPLVDSIMEMQDFWSGRYFSAVERKVTREQLFDLDVAREAQARLAKEQPFAR